MVAKLVNQDEIVCSTLSEVSIGAVSLDKGCYLVNCGTVSLGRMALSLEEQFVLGKPNTVISEIHS